ncbi:sulfotransferase family protein [Streptosporangium sp. NPDC051022]|uniref:sulfotransferase-like domain-containing protein n=1 Tax=Streptosporangium sp. NPDC051022 TaxID=3155752 RepID=UPI0034120D31
MSEPSILALWSAPRSRSTAFLRMMVERGDRMIVHHPFSDVTERGKAVLGEREVTEEEDLIELLRSVAHERPLFFKDTTDAPHPTLLREEHFLHGQVEHTFLIRDPMETIPSHYALNPDVRSEQIGFGHLYALFAAVRRASGRTPVVIDARDLVKTPDRIVRAYCEQVGIPYIPAALRWAPGERHEWRQTRTWHLDVSRSSGIEQVNPSHAMDLFEHPHLVDYLDQNQPFYREMHRCRIQV